MMNKLSIKLQKAHMITVLVNAYYETDSAGGCLHIVLDDGNYDRHHIEHCLKYSLELGDYWGEHLSKLLLEFNKDEVEQIVERPWEITGQIY